MVAERHSWCGAWSVFGLAGLLLMQPACAFDTSGLRSPSGQDGAVPADGRADASSGNDAAGGPDSGPPVDAGLDAQVVDAAPDAAPDAFVPPCTGDTFECRPDGSARVCRDDDWVVLGPCPLGCDAVAQACRVPSNVDAHLADDGGGNVTLAVLDSPVHIDTDTGRIYTPSGTEHRPPGGGLDVASGIFYGQQAQGADPGVGVLVLADFVVAPGVDVVVEGSRALAILASGDVTINGAVYLNSDSPGPGPGGYPGGDASQAGGGSCGGLLGAGTSTDHGCSSGSGGGGHGGLGGAGGNAYCDGHIGGAGGADTCGNPTLVPLVGGYGGAGTEAYVAAPLGDPGLGGGGGGALQITASGTLTVGPAGRIHAGGGPGGGSSAAGGAGGGSGGGILLESPSVNLAVGSILAANGGGGGGGDCT